MTIAITLNGENHRLERAISIGSLLQQQGYLASSAADKGDATEGIADLTRTNFIVAVNHCIVPLTDAFERQLQDQDQVDVMGAITGG